MKLRFRDEAQARAGGQNRKWEREKIRVWEDFDSQIAVEVGEDLRTGELK